MNKHIRAKTLVLMWLVALISFSHSSYADNQSKMVIENFRIVLPPSVARSTAGYGIIKNRGNASDTLIGISSNAGSVMLHKTDLSGGMGRMIHMPSMIIEANSELKLEPMSFHLMFTELCPITFVEGGLASITFEFEQAGEITVDVPVN